MYIVPEPEYSVHSFTQNRFRILIGLWQWEWIYISLCATAIAYYQHQNVLCVRSCGNFSGWHILNLKAFLHCGISLCDTKAHHHHQAFCSVAGDETHKNLLKKNFLFIMHNHRILHLGKSF